MTDPLFSGWPIEIDGRFPNQLVLGETPPRPKKLPPPPTFIEISPGNLRLLPRPSLDLQFWATKSLVDATTGTNLIDFTRASSGTYVGSDGLIKTATTNYLLQSEDFTTTWSSDGVCTVDPNQTLSPSGTLTADKITVDAGGPNRVSQTPTFQVSAGGTYILSAYIKTLDINQINIRLYLAGSDAYTDYAFATNSFFIVNNDVITETGYTSLSDGWTRIFVKYQPTVSGSVSIRFGGGIGGSSGNGSFYIWGAQLEQSSTVGEYVKTTSTINSAPRFDHDPTTGESLGLLVEESRTNLLPRSEEFDEATTDWFQVASTIDSDAIEAPDGNNTADKLIATDGATEHYVRKDFSATAGTTYAFSCFLKAAERSAFELAFRVAGVWPSGQNQAIKFTLTGNGSYSVTSGSPTGDIIAFGNDWYRCYITATAAVTGTAQVRVQDAYDADGEGIYLWGAQLEAGSFPTSYIPTTTSAVTRAADVASISGSNFSSWYRQDEGSFYVKAVSSVGSVIATADSGSLTSRKPQISVGSFSEVNSSYVESGTVLAFLSTGGTGTVFSHATAYANNDYAAARDGGNLAVDTSGALPDSVTTLRLGRLSNGVAPMSGHIRRLTYWQTRLPNEVLQAITQ